MTRILILLLTALPAAAQIQLVPRLRPAAKTPVAVEIPKDDRKILAEDDLSADDAAGLIAYFKKRTLTDVQLGEIKSIIRRMGDEVFAERIKASAEAIKFGLGAIGPLRTSAATDPDPEIQYRSLETLRQIEKVPQGVVASAAARALVKLKPPEAMAVMLGFLPLADSPGVEDDLRTALSKLAISDGKFHPVLVKGLTDVNPLRRGVSATAMIAASNEAQLLGDELAKFVVPMLRTETDGDAKFRVAHMLATTRCNADAIAALVEVMPSLPRGRIWQIEDILLQLAADKAPKIRLRADKSSLEKASIEWLAWLKANRKPEDYASFDYKPRTNGNIAMLIVDTNWGGGRIVEYGPDLRQRWRILNVMSPADFRMLPNGNIEIVEHNYSRIREVDIRGNQKSPPRTFPGGPPVSTQKLENGNFLVAYRQNVVEYDKDWKPLLTWTRNNGDILGAGRYGKGPTVVLVQNPGSLIRLDEKFKELPNAVKIGQPQYQAKIEMLPNDRVLVTEQNQVIEVDLKDGRIVWKNTASNPTCTQRLPNGNTLICELGNRTIREVSPEGDNVWTYTPPEGLQPLRAYRQ